MFSKQPFEVARKNSFKKDKSPAKQVGITHTTPKPFQPYRPVWYVPDQGMDYTILNN